MAEEIVYKHTSFGIFCQLYMLICHVAGQMADSTLLLNTFPLHPWFFFDIMSKNVRFTGTGITAASFIRYVN